MAISNDEIRVCLQNNIRKYARISVLNSSDNVIDRLEGLLVSGNYTIDSESNFRRSCDLTFTYADKLVPSQTSVVWFNRRFKLEIGIYDGINEEIVWFNLGIYMYQEADVEIDVSDRTVAIKGIDKMGLFTGDFGSSVVDVITNFSTEFRIDEAIRTVVRQLAGESRYLIDNMVDESGNPYMIPYKISEDAGSSLYQCISDLAELYRSYDFYYDVDGVFKLNKMNIFKKDPIIFDFADLNQTKDISCAITTTLSDVKNSVYIIGKSMEDGSQPRASLIKTNSTDPNSPFTVEKIGTQKYVQQIDSLQSIEQCQVYADYYMLLKCDLQQKVTTVHPCLFFLNEVNKLCRLYYPNQGIDGKYKIDKISGDLSTGQMTIDWSKVIE